VASLPLIKERILVIILLLHFLSLMLGSVLVLMLPLLVWLTPDLRIKKSLLKCNWTNVYELNRSGLLAENEKIRPILAQLEKLLLCDLSPSTNDSVKNRSEARLSRSAETDLVSRLLLEKKKLNGVKHGRVVR